MRSSLFRVLLLACVVCLVPPSAHGQDQAVAPDGAANAAAPDNGQAKPAAAPVPEPEQAAPAGNSAAERARAVYPGGTGQARSAAESASGRAQAKPTAAPSPKTGQAEAGQAKPDAKIAGDPAAGRAQAKPAPPARGQNLAQMLWTPAELAGKPGEARSGPLIAPDLSGPGKPAPEATRPALAQHLRGSIRRVDTAGRKLVALTFDLCELADKAAGYDAEVVDALRELDVAATFFAGGRWMRSHPERTMQLLADSRFEIGSHAWTHGNFGVLSAEKMRLQLDWTQAQFEVARQALAEKARAAGHEDLMRGVPTSIAVFRFPYGRCREQALELLAALGVAAVQWDVNTMDADKRQTPQGIVSNVTKSARPGSIVLAHANGNGHGTGQAVRLVVAALRAKGYEFVTVSGLLAAGRAETAPECYDSRPGDTAVYDSIFGDGTLHPHR